MRSAKLLLILVAFMSVKALAEASISLSEARWEHRVILVSTTSSEVASHLKQQLSAYPELRAERKLIGIIKSPDGILQIGNPNLSINSAAPTLTSAQDTVLLIGLDGGIKHRYPAETFDIDVMFSHIDAMPMRRAEMQQQ